MSLSMVKLYIGDSILKKYTEESKLRIYHTTFELIKTFGIKGWNMDMLCSELNIAKDTLYRIIKSKENLLNEMMDEILSQHESQVDKIIKDEEDFNVTLEKLSITIAKFLVDFGTLQLKSLFKEYPSIQKNVNDYALRFDYKVSGLLRNGIDNGIIKENVDVELVSKSVRYISIAILSENVSHADSEISKYISYIMEGIKVKNYKQVGELLNLKMI